MLPILAKCPVCQRQVPRRWVVVSRARPCPTCASLIRPVRLWDWIGNFTMAALNLIGIGVGLLLMAEGAVRTGIAVIAGAFAFVMTMAALIYPYTTPFERAHAGIRSCPTCGYDLRATPDRCPECGTILGRFE